MITFRKAVLAAGLSGLLLAPVAAQAAIEIREYDLPPGAYPHDVAPAPEANGPVWYAAQRIGALGVLDPKTGKAEHISLGKGSSPHGVIVGPDGAPWLTDGGLNAIVRVDPQSREVKAWKLPSDHGYTNLNTAAFDNKKRIWFTGQNGIYGRVDTASGDVRVWKAPKGRGPYGIAATPDGRIYYASLAGSYIAWIDTESGNVSVIEPPTRDQGARRVWSDSKGVIWVSEWNSGQVSRFEPSAANPAMGSWKAWMLPGEKPRTYAVYVDETDAVWLSDWGANAMVRFDPVAQSFNVFPASKPQANVRQILGRKGEVWVPESGTERLVVYRWR